MKSMKSTLVNILSIVGGGAGKLEDFGIELDDDGRLSLDSDKLGTKLDADPTSVQSFFVGGTFTTENGSTLEVDGVFAELEDEVAKYSKYGNILDDYKESIDTRMESLNEQRERAVERLNSSYNIMAKRFAAYDLMISRFNNASDMFTQMINAEIAANK
jgi:flagellar hook-associated protein 2